MLCYNEEQGASLSRNEREFYTNIYWEKINFQQANTGSFFTKRNSLGNSLEGPPFQFFLKKEPTAMNQMTTKPSPNVSLSQKTDFAGGAISFWGMSHPFLGKKEPTGGSNSIDTL